MRCLSALTQRVGLTEKPAGDSGRYSTLGKDEFASAASTVMKLSRTKEYHFGWLGLITLVDVVFLLIFFLLLSSNFILQPGISVSLPLSRFTLGPQLNPQIISITGGAAPAIFFRDQKVGFEQLGPLLDAARADGRPIIIKADRQTPYEMVVAVTNAALEHGITSVSLATAPEK